MAYKSYFLYLCGSFRIIIIIGRFDRVGHIRTSVQTFELEPNSLFLSLSHVLYPCRVHPVSRSSCLLRRVCQLTHLSVSIIAFYHDGAADSRVFNRRAGIVGDSINKVASISGLGGSRDISGVGH